MHTLLFTQQPVLLLGLERVLSSVSNLTLHGALGDGQKLLAAVKTVKPEILFMEFSAEENFGTLLELRAVAPECRIVLWVRKISAELAYQVMRIGVRGIVRSTLGAEAVIECLKAISAGESWFDDELKSSFFGARSVALSPRESQLVILVAQGLTNKEIAGVLGISETTVRIYLSALFRRLGFKNRYELAICGMKKLLDVEMHPEETGKATGGDQQVRFLILERPRSKKIAAFEERPLKVRGAVG